MNIRLIVVSKTDVPYLQTGIDEYIGRLKHYCDFEDADGKGEKFCRPPKKFSQASQIAEQSLTPTLSFREGGMKDNEKYLRLLMADL